MYTCTHSNQGVGVEVGGLRQNHSPTPGHPGFHQTMHGGGADMSSQGGINSCIDACTHSNQGV